MGRKSGTATADTGSLDKQLEEARAKHSGQLAEMRRYMEENTRLVQDQAAYNRQFAAMDEACKITEERIDSLQQQVLAQHGRREQIRRSISELEKCGNALDGFSLDVWNAEVESVTVSSNKILAFLFYDGTKKSVKLPEKKP